VHFDTISVTPSPSRAIKDPKEKLIHVAISDFPFPTFASGKAQRRAKNTAVVICYDTREL